MPFKVKCRFVGFMGDAERFPCHFGYKPGDEFVYDGETFTGRICAGLLGGMTPVVLPLHYGGNKYAERIVFRYCGHSVPEPSMATYDGQGWAPSKEIRMASGEVKQVELAKEMQKGWTFTCGDARTSAFFLAEPFDLAEGGNHTPIYKREMSIFEKISKEPGVGVDDILARFTDGEREKIWPPLTQTNVQLMMDELEAVNYIEIRDKKAYPKARK